MKIFCLLIASLFMGFAWLSPFHDQPWVTFSSEIATFFAGLILLTIFFNQPLRIPKIQLWVLPFVFIPLLQWSLGLVFDFGHALVSTLYLFGFWLMIILGFNLSIEPNERKKLMQYISYLLLGISLICSLFAMTQWLGMSVSGVMRLEGSRPYANFGQPNNLATFLILGILGGIYLYEIFKISPYFLIPINILNLFVVALTQSRTSWIVCIFICLYWGYKTYKKNPRTGISILCVWGGFYVVLVVIGVKILTNLIGFYTQFEVIELQSAIERVGSGYLRFDIWTQMLLALKEQGVFGYGWNQASIAQMSVFHLHPSVEWVSSAHNIILDLLIWNGIPLGLLIVGAILIWFLWLNKNIDDTVSIVAMLMVGTVFIHSMLEFPYRYAYFLLPVGLLLGVIQAQTPLLKSLLIDKIIIRFYGVIFFIITLLIWRDYKICHAQLKVLSNQQSVDSEIMGSSRVIFLNQFSDLIQWAWFNPLTKMSDEQLQMVDQIVKKNPTMYNLGKYSMLLVYNNKNKMAEDQLYILNHLYRQSIHVSDIVEINKKALQRHDY